MAITEDDLGRTVENAAVDMVAIDGGLALFTMGDTEKALKFLSEVEALDNNHLGARQFRTLIEML